MPTTKTPTDAEIVEVLATKGMRYERVTWENVDGELVATPSGAGRVDRWHWNPLADLNAVHEVEKRLSEEQRDDYITELQRIWKTLGEEWDFRHANARTCCLALWEVLAGA